MRLARLHPLRRDRPDTRLKIEFVPPGVQRLAEPCGGQDDEFQMPRRNAIFGPKLTHERWNVRVGKRGVMLLGAFDARGNAYSMSPRAAGLSPARQPLARAKSKMFSMRPQIRLAVTGVDFHSGSKQARTSGVLIASMGKLLRRAVGAGSPFGP